MLAGWVALHGLYATCSANYPDDATLRALKTIAILAVAVLEIQATLTVAEVVTMMMMVAVALGLGHWMHTQAT